MPRPISVVNDNSPPWRLPITERATRNGPAWAATGPRGLDGLCGVNLRSVGPLSSEPGCAHVLSGAAPRRPSAKVSSRRAPRSCRAQRSPDACARSANRSRPASSTDPSDYRAPHLGIKTASITWITPFEASISALTTEALSIFTPLLVSMATSPPCTVLALLRAPTSFAITFPETTW